MQSILSRENLPIAISPEIMEILSLFCFLYIYKVILVKIRGLLRVFHILIKFNILVKKLKNIFLFNYIKKSKIVIAQFIFLNIWKFQHIIFINIVIFNIY